MAITIRSSLALVFLVFASVSAERLYTQPTIQRNPSPTPPSYAAAVNPNRNVGPPKGTPVQLGTTPRSIPVTKEFLPQNLTFVVSVRNLKAKTVDPVVKVSKAGKNGTYETLGKTESYDNNANPDFLKVFWIIWNKGTQQKLKFEVRDVDNFRRDDPLGQAVIDLDEYVARREQMNVTLQNGTGTISIQKTVPVKFRLYARGLPNEDTLGHSDPYVECFWSTGTNGQKNKFGQSSVIENTENPDWNDTFEFANYIKGTNQYWTFKVWDKDPSGSDDLGEAILEIDSFIDSLVAKRQTKIFTLAKKGAKHGANTARLSITPA